MKLTEVENSEHNVMKKKSLYPKGAFFVLGNEFAERFSFYGMRTLLVLYFINVHLMPEHTAKVIYHTFVAVSYVTPLFGSLLADGYFGKFRVIVGVSFLYVVGHGLMTLGAFFDAETSAGLLRLCDFGGLVLIAFANGGLKPCVPAFAGDQFPPGMNHQRKKFFSYFYSSVNYGALLSIVLTPLLRSRVSCFGRDSCYALAFGVPAFFMIAAFVLFLIGRRYYTIVKEESVVIWKAIQCVFYAFFKLLFSPGGKSWTEHAAKKFDKRLIEDVKSLVRVLVIFIPVVPFWALLDQQGSTWVLQANRMSGKVGRMTVLPDQMLMLNPLLVILLVPLFETVVYPLLARWRILVKPLRRMGWGGVFIASSFVVSGLLQMIVERSNIKPLPEDVFRFVILNHARCDLLISQQHQKHPLEFSGAVSTVLKMGERKTLNLSKKSPIKFAYANCSAVVNNDKNSEAQFWYPNLHINGTRAMKKSTGYFLFVYESSSNNSNQTNLTISYANFEFAKTKSGKSRLYVHSPRQQEDIVAPLTTMVSSNASLIVKQADKIISSTELTHNEQFVDISPTFWQSANKGLYTVILQQCPERSRDFGKRNENCTIMAKATYEPKTGESRMLIIPAAVDWNFRNDGTTDNSRNDGTDSIAALEVVELIPGNTVSIAWQFPQFLLITIGEIMFAVTGLEFSYSQASVTLKSVLLALWYLNNAMGNLLAVIISGSKIVKDPVHEFFLYAGLVYLATLIFSIVARRYRYVPGTEPTITPEPVLTAERRYNRSENGTDNYRVNGIDNKIPLNGGVGMEMKQKRGAGDSSSSYANEDESF